MYNRQVQQGDYGPEHWDFHQASMRWMQGGITRQGRPEIKAALGADRVRTFVTFGALTSKYACHVRACMKAGGWSVPAACSLILLAYYWLTRVGCLLRRIRVNASRPPEACSGFQFRFRRRLSKRGRPATSSIIVAGSGTTVVENRTTTVSVASVEVDISLAAT